MKIAVIGTGTAGIISLGHILAAFPDGTEVYSIYDPKINILGIGESTGVTIPHTLFTSTNFNLMEDSDELDATIKHGVKYVGWRKKDMYSHILPPAAAMHFNNFKIREFSFGRFKKIWGNKFKVIEDSVVNIDQTSTAATVELEKHGKMNFDYVIDCSGWPKDYSEYNTDVFIPVNHCLVNMIPEPGKWDYTYHVAHRNGWMFGIPLKTRQGWGYLYNDDITSREDAVDDIAERFKTNKDDLNLREYSWKNYYSKKIVDGRIIKNGNKALFFEPIEALSGLFYDTVIRAFTDLALGQHREEDINNYLTQSAEELETTISFIYHGGSTYDSDFWNITSEKAAENIKNSETFNIFLDQLKRSDKSELGYGNLSYGGFTAKSWIDFDTNFGYNYVNIDSEFYNERNNNE